MAKKSHRWVAVVAITAMLLALVIAGQGMAKDAPPHKEKLGEALYFDENLSEPAGQSCASCHLPEAGFVDPDDHLPVSEGVIAGRFGGRNSPASAYAMYAPALHYIIEEGDVLWIGGQFWDGRATGWVLGDPLADQALGPFVNKLEMNNPDEATVIRDVKASDYAGLFEQVWGRGSLDNVETAYDQVALSIAAFERTKMFGQFSSKYDHYLKSCLRFGGDPDDCATGKGAIAWAIGQKFFTPTEWAGFQLFMDDEDGGAKCVLCHVADWTVDPGNVVVPKWAPDGMIPPMFTDFTYDNLGVPKSEHPLLVNNPVDYGLGPIVKDTAQNGKFKVMTLRNIGLTAPYAHNGFFETLKDITHFYNTRDVAAEGWPAPEVPETVNFDELGNLGLTNEQEDLLVEFMMTLSDGWE
jgi:cytochrome c peroxidase